MTHRGPCQPPPFSDSVTASLSHMGTMQLNKLKIPKHPDNAEWHRHSKIRPIKEPSSLLLAQLAAAFRSSKPRWPSGVFPPDERGNYRFQLRLTGLHSPPLLASRATQERFLLHPAQLAPLGATAQPPAHLHLKSLESHGRLGFSLCSTSLLFTRHST